MADLFPIDNAHKYPLHVFDGATELDARQVTFTASPEGIVEVRGDTDQIRKVWPLSIGSCVLTFVKGLKSGTADFTVSEGPDGELTLTLDAGQPL